MSNLNLVLPGLVWHESADYGYLYKQLNVPILSKLLSRAKLVKHTLSYSDFVYSSHLGNESLARAYANQLGLTDYKGYVLAEPTHLRVDRDRLLIAETELLQLSEDESRQIIALINQHFAGELMVYYVQDNLWLMGINLDLADLTSYPIVDIIGENVDEYLPLGKSRLHLHRIMNEIQMLFFDMPLNQLRNEDGLLVVNSLWLWDKKLSALPFSLSNVVSNNAQFGELLTNLALQIRHTNTLIIDKAYYPAQYRDSFAWVSALHEIENNLLAVVYNQLKSGVLGEINIWLPGLNSTIQYKIRRRDLWKFWHNKSFEEISQQLVVNEE